MKYDFVGRLEIENHFIPHTHAHTYTHEATTYTDTKIFCELSSVKRIYIIFLSFEAADLIRKAIFFLEAQMWP